MKKTEINMLCALSNSFRMSEEQTLATDDIEVKVDGNKITIVKDSNGAMEAFLKKLSTRPVGDTMEDKWIENKNIEKQQYLHKLIRCKDCMLYPDFKGYIPEKWTWPINPNTNKTCPCRTIHTDSSWIPEDDWFCADGILKDEEIGDNFDS